jgi:hypothetical protein
MGDALITTWRTPGGDEVASRVAVPPAKWTIRAIADALVYRYESRVREGLAAYREQHPRELPAALVTTEVGGEELHFLGRRHDLEGWAKGFPGIVRESLRGPDGFDPVLVDSFEWGALVWLARGKTDVATPPTRYEWHEDAGPCPPSLPDLHWVPHRVQPVPKSRRRPQPEPTAEEWRASLAKSLSHIVRFVELRAPQPLIDQAMETARSRMAKLEPGDAEAVLRAWPRAARLLSRDWERAHPKPGRERPN